MTPTNTIEKISVLNCSHNINLNSLFLSIISSFDTFLLVILLIKYPASSSEGNSRILTPKNS